MGISVTILGSGICVPSRKRNSSSFLLPVYHNLLLFDLVAGTMRRLLEAGFTISQVSHIFFSHLHPDHTGEFVSFLFATKYPQTYRRRAPFRIIGSRGLHNFYDGLRAVYKEWIELEPGLMNLIEMDNDGRDQFANDAFSVDNPTHVAH